MPRRPLPPRTGDVDAVAGRRRPICRVAIDVSGEPDVEQEREAVAVMAREYALRAVGIPV
jgi:hypothetical protein